MNNIKFLKCLEELNNKLYTTYAGRGLFKWRQALSWQQPTCHYCASTMGTENIVAIFSLQYEKT
jgi:hypothetical protein